MNLPLVYTNPSLNGRISCAAHNLLAVINARTERLKRSRYIQLSEYSVTENEGSCEVFWCRRPACPQYLRSYEWPLLP